VAEQDLRSDDTHAMRHVDFRRCTEVDSALRRSRFSHVTDSVDDTAKVDVVVTEVIGRPLATVARYSCDPSHAPEWYANISTVEWKTPPPVRVGSRVAFVARFVGRQLRYTYEVTEHTEDSLVMRTAEGPFPMETIYRFESMPGGRTRMTLRNRGNPEGFSRLIGPFIAGAMRRSTKKDLKALKELLEGV
jgi:hypothetical protein